MSKAICGNNYPCRVGTCAHAEIEAQRVGNKLPTLRLFAWYNLFIKSPKRKC